MATIQEQREVSGFDAVKIEGSGTLLIQQGEEDRLVIETEETLLPKIKSEVVEGRLVLGFKSWLDHLFTFGHPPITYHVTMREVRGLSISGSGKVKSSDLTTDRLSLRISGSSEIDLGRLSTDSLEVKISGSGKVIALGKATEADLRISGSGDLRTAELACETARVSISGAGNVQIMVSQKLDVRISGSGDVRYSGEPSISQSISGSGNIRRV